MATSESGKKTFSLTGSVIRPDTTDKIVEGLRIPPSLDNQLAVNFVLTQEAGKLKPKDLKIAIEKNRAERELRAEEQRKLRDQGGGAGVLDLRGILAEERLNFTQGDAFKRQLREIAFLADVEEVEKQEQEKEFRISEEYLGARQLSEEDIQTVLRQRMLAQQHAWRSQWLDDLNIQSTIFYPPSHPTVKAGTDVERAQDLVAMSNPSFDPNRNDVWAKRMTTLRRFIYLVSKWIIRRRLDRRMGRLMAKFHENGAYTRAEVRAYIEKENEEYKNNSMMSASAATAKEKPQLEEGKETMITEVVTGKRNLTFAELLFSEPFDVVEIQKRDEKIIQAFQYAVKHNEAEFSTSMARRRLFPVMDRNTMKRGGGTEPSVDPSAILLGKVAFDDRSYFRLKVKPDYKVKGYKAVNYPTLPLYYPSSDDKETRLLAPEEQFARGPVDANVTERHLTRLGSQLLSDPAEMEPLRKECREILADLYLFPRLDDRLQSKEGKEKIPFPLPPPPPLPAAAAVGATAGELSQGKGLEESRSATSSTDMHSMQLELFSHTLPNWMTTEPIFSFSELNSVSLRPAFRSYLSPLSVTEQEVLFPIKPCLEEKRLELPSDSSLRSQWIDAKGGFETANRYLLGNLRSSIPLEQVDGEGKKTTGWGKLPEPGPTLFDHYMPDHDRHVSGLHCYGRDHERDVVTWDADVRGLAQGLDKEDHLTDSESDDDEAYQAEKPTLKQAKALLAAPVVREEEKSVDVKKKGGGAAESKKTDPKAKAVAVAAAAPSAAGLEIGKEEDDGDETLLGEHERREEQVELLRDRKLLDLASTSAKERRRQLDKVCGDFAEVAKGSHPLYSVEVTMPFHRYEDEVYKWMAPHVPERSQVLVELDPNLITLSAPPTSLSMTSLPPYSPTRR